jgi:ERI1 exoribonuclease 3
MLAAEPMLTTLAVLDFEATCADRNVDPMWDSSQQEIIEFPVALVSIAERRVVDSFATFVRPSRQPILTAFCTQLTTIQQEDLEGQPMIGEVLTRFATWLDAHGITDDNTCAVTCGDWDLRRMWPLQASLVPDLHGRTPRLFRRWCNLKVAFGAHTGTRASGMMGMLQQLGLAHEGVHHRGVDDVKNLCKVVTHLLEAGAEIRPTWTERERDVERQLYETKLLEASSALAAKRAARDELPPSVPETVRAKFDDQLEHLSSELDRWRAYVGVFT